MCDITRRRKRSIFWSLEGEQKTLLRCSEREFLIQFPAPDCSATDTSVVGGCHLKIPGRCPFVGRRSHERLCVLFGGDTVWPINNGGLTWFNKVYFGLIILNHSRDGHIVLLLALSLSLVFLVFNLWGFVGCHSFQSIHDNVNSIINMLVEWQKQSITKPVFWVAKNSYHQLSISRWHCSLPSEVSWGFLK